MKQITFNLENFMDNFSPNAQIEVLEDIVTFITLKETETMVAIPAGILEAQIKDGIVSLRDNPITLKTTDKRIKVVQTKD